MKLLDILLEDVGTPFNKKCVINISNNDGETISVDCEVPTTPEEKITGLMNRDSLDKNSGMFYDYVDGGFWMDNVKFPIEMVFINGNEIADIQKALPHDETSIQPSVESDGNLEVNEGFCESNNISVGNKVYIS